MTVPDYQTRDGAGPRTRRPRIPLALKATRPTRHLRTRQTTGYPCQRVPGRGKQNEQPLETLSALINALNERFGTELGEADRIWFEQQESVLRNDEDVRVVALNNDFQQFEVYLVEPKVQDRIIERQEANDGLFQAFFDKPEFNEQMLKWLTKSPMTASGRTLVETPQDALTGSG